MQTIKENKLLIISFVGFFLFSFIESMRLTNLTDKPEELSFSLSTFPAVVIIMSITLFLMIMARYRNNFRKTHYMVRLLFLPAIFTVVIIGYLLGLNIRSMLGMGSAGPYVYILPLGILALLLLGMLFGYFKLVQHHTKRLYLLILATTIYSISLMLLMQSIVSSYILQFPID